MENFIFANLILLWLIALVSLVLILALIRKLNTASRVPQTGLKPGMQAPDFTAQRLNGEMVTLSSFAGKKVAFIFIASHCQPCREALPKYKTLYPKARQAGVELVLVSTDELEATRNLVEEMEIQLPIIIAPDHGRTFMESYGLNGTPSYTLIGETGKIQSAGYPSVGIGEWKKLTDAWEESFSANVTNLTTGIAS